MVSNILAWGTMLTVSEGVGGEGDGQDSSSSFSQSTLSK